MIFFFYFPLQWKVGYQSVICQNAMQPNSCCGLYGKHQALCKAAKATQSREHHLKTQDYK